MADDKLPMPDDYDAEASPVDATERSPRGTGELVDGLKRLARINTQQVLLDAKRKAVMRELLPQMKTPVLIHHPVTGKPVIVAAQQSKPIKVDVGELRAALLEYGFDADDTETIVAGVLKPPEVDTKEDGLFVKACESDSPLKIPLEVVAKVAKEKPSSAYIGFNQLRPAKATGPAQGGE